MHPTKSNLILASVLPGNAAYMIDVAGEFPKVVMRFSSSNLEEGFLGVDFTATGNHVYAFSDLEIVHIFGSSSGKLASLLHVSGED